VTLLRDLAPRLDPADAGDAARIRWIFENDHRRDAVVGGLADRASRTAKDQEFRDVAELVRGQAAADSGDPEQAEACFLVLLEKNRGSGLRAERFAALALAKLFAHQRRGFEALSFARLGANLARKAGHTFDLCVARARVCMALQVMDDGERLARAVDELERGLADVREEAARPLRFMALALRVQAALEAEDAAGARQAMTVLRGLADASGDLIGDPRLLLYLEAEIEAQAGRPAEALARVAEARRLPALLPTSDLPLSLLEARCLCDRGDLETARQVVHDLLDRLDDEPDPDPFGTAQRIRWSVQAGRLLQERCADPDGARRGFDLAAGWVVRRIVEIDRAIREMPELSAVSAEDLGALTDHRNRFLLEQVEILDRVGALFAGKAPPPGLVHGETGGEEGYFHACAWCRRVKTAEDRWLPIGEFLPDDHHLRISHGICDDCRKRWMERTTAG
jgi:hypothetical protein